MKNSIRIVSAMALCAMLMSVMVIPGVLAMNTGTKFVGDLGDSPIGHWEFGELAGDAVNSGSAGTGYNGAVYGCTRGETGKLGNCYGFDGSNDYVQVPDGRNDLDFGNGDDFSVFCWIYADTNNRPIIYKYDQSRGYSMYIDSSDHLQVNVYLTTSATGATGTTDIVDNEWHHVGLVRDGSTVRAWVDGVEEDTGPNANGNTANNGDLYFGYFSSSYYDGKMDDVRIYNRVVNPTADMISHWDMEDGTGQAVTDRVDSNNGWLGTSPFDNNGDPTWDWTNPKVGSYCLIFDASESDRVTVPSANNLNFGDGVDFSIFCWVKVDTRGTIINKHSIYAGYYLTIISGGFLEAQVISLSSSDPATGTSDVADGDWHHVGMVRHGDTLEVWVDGFCEDSVTGAGGTLVNNDVLTIGTDGYSYFDGRIDDVRVFGEAVVPAN
jgi:hypothetical protein